MQRKTKIIATLGPATQTDAAVFDLLSAGVGVGRLNFSHGLTDDHVARAQIVRAESSRLNKPVAILCDLQGPKIRIGKFSDGGVSL